MLTGKNRGVTATEKENADIAKYKHQGFARKHNVQLPCCADTQHPNRNGSSVQHFLTSKKGH